MKYFIVALLAPWLMIGCITKGHDQNYMGHEELSSKDFVRSANWEYRCLPYTGEHPQAFQETLNMLGLKGWQLSGFIVKKGNTTAYCVKKRNTEGKFF